MASFHVTVNSVGRRTIAPDGDQRRAMRQRVLLTYGDRIGLYAFVDDHGHLVVDVPVEAARRFAGRVVRILSACTGLRFESHVKPVDGRRHLSSLVSYLASRPRAATTRRARKVAVDLGTHAGFRQVDIARALDMSPSRVCELTQQPADEVAGEVARRRLAVMVAKA